MNKIIFSIFTLLLSFCVGCGNPIISNPYIDNIQTSQTYGRAGDAVDFVIYAVNPLSVNFQGDILIQSDSPDCFGLTYIQSGSYGRIQAYNTTILITANSRNSVLATIHIPDTIQNTCYQPSNHRITVFLLQNSKVYSTKNIDFSLFQR
jgi:hypothetical protein